jgi:CBS domain containing-hemolysin-like protein
MTSAALLWIAAGGLGGTFLASVGVRTMHHFSAHELKDLCRRAKKPDRLGHILRWRESVSLAAQSLKCLTQIVYVAAIAFWLFNEWQAGALPGPWVVVDAALAMLLLLIAAAWAPWSVGHLWAEPFLYHTWPGWWALSVALMPLVAGARVVDIALHRMAGRVRQTPDEDSFEEDIRTIVTEGHREGLLEEEAREMIEGVIELSDVDVARIMTPRTDMVSIPNTLTWSEMLEQVIDAGHTRIPVYGRNRDDILGILHMKELLPELAKPVEERIDPWTRLLRQPIFVPETKPIDALLQELQRSRNHMVVVLDEYGGVSGLVTIEDVLEEIVGEIVDEYDTALVDGLRDIGPGACEALGRVHIDEINERLHLSLPEDADFDTIGGFVFSELGHVPIPGETLNWQNVRITVLEATRRRIERVRIEALDLSQMDVPSGVKEGA